jgi:hypothetical protein
MRTVVVGYCGIGVVLAGVYLLHSGLGVANMLIHLPIGWVTMLGMVVAWPVILGAQLYLWLARHLR